MYLKFPRHKKGLIAWHTQPKWQSYCFLTRVTCERLQGAASRMREINIEEFFFSTFRFLAIFVLVMIGVIFLLS